MRSALCESREILKTPDSSVKTSSRKRVDSHPKGPRGRRIEGPRPLAAGMVTVSARAQWPSRLASLSSPEASSTGGWSLQGKSIQRSVRFQTYSHFTIEIGFS